MQNIDLSSLEKKKFTINNDPNRVLELDTTDFGVITRFEEKIDHLASLQDKFTELGSMDNDDIMQKTHLFTEVENGMREIIDYIFDSNVCEVCAPKGSMFSPINGKFRYEIIIETLLSLYEKDINKETQRIEKDIQKHTKKYTAG